MHDEKLILITSIRVLKLPSYKTGCQYSTGHLVVQSDAHSSCHSQVMQY